MCVGLFIQLCTHANKIGCFNMFSRHIYNTELIAIRLETTKATGSFETMLF